MLNGNYCEAWTVMNLSVGLKTSNGEMQIIVRLKISKGGFSRDVSIAE